MARLLWSVIGCIGAIIGIGIIGLMAFYQFAYILVTSLIIGIPGYLWFRHLRKGYREANRRKYG